MIVLIILINHITSKQCNTTQFVYFDLKYLHKDNEVIQPFQQVCPKGIKQIVNLERTLFINNFILKCQANTGKLKVIDQDRYIINITGSYATFLYQFDWQWKNQTKGKALGRVKSGQLNYDKQLVLKNQILRWQLLQFSGITIEQDLNIIRIQPYQKQIYQQMLHLLNQVQNHTKVKDILIQSLSDYQNALKQQIHKEIWKNHTNYTFFSNKGKQTINYNHPYKDYKLSKKGFQFSLATVIDGFQNMVCGETPQHQQNTSIYGGIQSLWSYGLFQSSILYSIQKGYFDTKLNKYNWGTDSFQFYAGDLYQVIPQIVKYPPTTAITGDCKAINNSSFFSFHAKDDKFKVNLQFKCQLFIGQTLLFSIEVFTQFGIGIKLKQESLEFNVQSVESDCKFNKGQFIIQNPQLAKYLLSQSLQTTLHSPTIGTNYPTTPRNSPHFHLQPSYLLIYDSSSI